jgi:hypothetical protein
MCGALVAYSGWESAFYVIGCITFVWFAFWWFLVCTFDECPFRP